MLRGIPIAMLMMLALFVQATAQDAETEPVGARSGYTEGPGVVPRGHLILEGGSTIGLARGERTLAIGEALLHVPAGRGMEIQAAVNSYVMTHCPDGDDSELEDAFVALKVPLSSTWNLSLGMTAPMSGRAYRERAFQPRIKLIAGRPLGERATLAANLGYAYARESGERFHQAAGSLWLGYRLTDRAGCYAETYGYSAFERMGGMTAYTNTGITYQLTRNCALDIHLGTGIRNAGSGYTAGIGLARGL
jgi:hypothetical protein